MIKSEVNIDQITKECQQQALKAEEMIIQALCRIGEECVVKAKDRSMEESWIDHTGNLRSSIGYVVAINGEPITYAGFSGANEGSMTGKDLATDLLRIYNQGYTLIVVAGMKYAAHVEALDNKDVLAPAELYERNRAPGLLKA